MRLASFLFAALMSLAAPLHATERPVVIELFTSQGCSSCPPADALLHELTKRDDVIALSLHVDYWDYIGWKDQFADPAFAERQRAYARAGGRRMIYTPQMIVNGQDSVVGVKPMKLNDLIRAHQNQPVVAEVEIEAATGGEYTVRVMPSGGGSSVGADVHLVRYSELRSADIKRGENAGRTIDYANVVEDWTHVGQWDGTSAREFTVELNGSGPGVILVQSRNNGRIKAAGIIR